MINYGGKLPGPGSDLSLTSTIIIISTKCHWTCFEFEYHNLIGPIIFLVRIIIKRFPGLGKSKLLESNDGGVETAVILVK